MPRHLLAFGLLLLSIVLATAFHSARADTPLCSATGATSSEYFGGAIAALDDVDSDDVADFVVGSPNYSSGCTLCGKISIMSGADCSVIQTINGTGTNTHFGFALTRLTDVNDDGIADFAASGPGDGYATTSYIRVYSGADISLLYTITNSPSYGLYISDAGDIDGDGATDILANSWGYSGSGGFGVTVYSGADGSTVVRHFGGSSESFGTAATALTRSYNAGDTIPDILVEPPYYNPNGAGDFRVRGGVTDNSTIADGVICLYGYSSSSHCQQTGTAYAPANVVVSVSDINNDGYDELAFGTPGYTYGNPAVLVYGGVRVLSGAPPNYPLLFSRTGLDKGYGSEMITLPDLNADGHVDLLVSSYGSSSSAYDYVEVLSGDSGVSIHQIFSDTLNDAFSYATSSLADVNADGTSDLLIGSPNHDSARGRVQLFPGPVTHCYPNAYQYLQNHTETGVKIYRASAEISAGNQVTAAPYGDYIVSGSSANVSLQAGSRITLAPGFSVTGGGTFSARVVAGTCS